MTPTHLCENWYFLAVLVSDRTLRPEAIVCSGRRRFQLTQLSDCQPLFLLIQLVSVTQYSQCVTTVRLGAEEVPLFSPFYHRPVLLRPSGLYRSLFLAGHHQLRKIRLRD